ncbi:MAG: ribonuclease H-like domain-containing protein [Dehalococcoidia bacterium]
MDPRERLRERLRETLGAGRVATAAPGPARPAHSENDVAEPFTPASRPSRDPGVAHYLPGFWQDTPVGRVFVVERRFELEHRHGALPLGRTVNIAPALLARLGRDAALAAVDLRRVAFLDTETTGLAGGTGTVAFLVGMGHFLDGHFRLRQYFLEDLDGEEAMIRALTDYLADFDGVVTFNGKTFDMPLLATRVRMTRTRRGLDDIAHLDLLHPARRLYRDRIPSCRLQELERRYLGLERMEDIPGWEIPSVYFRYVRTRRFRALLPVFEHNALDVLSLVTLAAHLARVWRGDGLRDAGDRLALGRACETEGELDEALEHYLAALDCTDLRPAEQEDCERRLSLLYKRLDRPAEALAVWYRVANRPDNRSLYPLLEIAKHYEHVAKDLSAARAACERALALLDGYHARMGYAHVAADRRSLLNRLARIETRLAREAERAARPRRTHRATDAVEQDSPAVLQ